MPKFSIKKYANDLGEFAVSYIQKWSKKNQGGVELEEIAMAFGIALNDCMQGYCEARKMEPEEAFGLVMQGFIKGMGGQLRRIECTQVPDDEKEKLH